MSREVKSYRILVADDIKLLGKIRDEDISNILWEESDEIHILGKQSEIEFNVVSQNENGQE